MRVKQLVSPPHSNSLPLGERALLEEIGHCVKSKWPIHSFRTAIFCSLVCTSEKHGVTIGILNVILDEKWTNLVPLANISCRCGILGS